MSILQRLPMSGRGYAHHLGNAHRRWWLPCVPRWYPPNPAIPGVPPRKAPAHVRKALILRTFCPACAKIVWYFGGIYRHVFRGYRWKNSILPPLYPTPPKPYFVTPLSEKCNPTFVTPPVTPLLKSTLQSEDFHFAPPLPYHTTSRLSHQPKSAPYSRQKPAYKGFYHIGNKKGRMQTIQPSDVNFRQDSPLPYTLKIKRHVSQCKRFVLCGPMQPSRITLWQAKPFAVFHRPHPYTLRSVPGRNERRVETDHTFFDVVELAVDEYLPAARCAEQYADFSI